MKRQFRCCECRQPITEARGEFRHVFVLLHTGEEIGPMHEGCADYVIYDEAVNSECIVREFIGKDES